MIMRFSLRSLLRHRRSFSTRDRGTIVQKFGGTSLGTADKINKVVNIIKSKYENNNVAAVVSAFSSETKQEGTTSRLLAAAEAAVKGEQFYAYKFIDAIEETHTEVINGSLELAQLKVEAQDFVHEELHRIKMFCDSLAVIEEISPKSHDLIIGCGERLAAGVLAKVLQERGLKATYVDLSRVFPKGLDTTSRNYSQIAKNSFASLLKPIVETNSIPVVTGYFGHVRGGILGSIGRGYTDLTAALCAGALSAQQLQVWKESDGVFTGNPTKIAKAQLIHKVTPSEAAELTYFGNEVLHPFTMACAIGDNVPIAILNTFKPDGHGTVISSEWYKAPGVLSKRVGKLGVAAICSKNGITVLNLSNAGLLEQHSYLLAVFQTFENLKVRADLISTSMNKITITLQESAKPEEVENLVNELRKYSTCDVKTDKAIVSCIGQGMKSQKGLAAHMFKSLSENDINIEMISQGSSEINISVVIDSVDQSRAIHCLHHSFIE